MKPAKRPLPPVLDRFVDAVVQAAKDHALHGRVRVESDEEAFRVVVTIPRSETVMTRAPKR